MIGFFPEPYPDELVYSVLARYYAHSGYMGYVYAADDLFVRTWNRPEIRFVNAYTDDAYRNLTRNRTMEELVLLHTMFPHYGRFLPSERRKRAFDALVRMDVRYKNELPIPKHVGGDSFLRYCPLCVQDDRQKYGETYWHRIHQMEGIFVCPVHGCLLYESQVQISGKPSPTLLTAEDKCSEESVLFRDSDKEWNLVKYMADLMEQEMYFDAPDISRFLHSRLIGTSYASRRGLQRNIKRLYEDFSCFYEDYSVESSLPFWKLQKIFDGDRYYAAEIGMVGLFLRIPVEELARMEVPEVRAEERFDREVYSLREQGVDYPSIARLMHASINLVKPIGLKCQKMGFNSETGMSEQKQNGVEVSGKAKAASRKKQGGRKSGKSPADWHEIDIQTLPDVKRAIMELKEKDGERPVRITVHAIKKHLHLPDKRLEQLPNCLQEIGKHEETWEEYWAREVIWATKRILLEGKKWQWTSIRRLTNMRRDDLRRCLPYVEEYAEAELAEKIREIAE